MADTIFVLAGAAVYQAAFFIYSKQTAISSSGMTKQKPIKNIPVYHLEKLSGQSGNPDIFFNEHQINTADLVINKPYRSNYFGIGVCTAGRAILKANLETYAIEKNCLV